MIVKSKYEIMFIPTAFKRAIFIRRDRADLINSNKKVGYGRGRLRVASVGTGLAPISANLRKEVRTNGGCEDG